ncbi:hypothetical protein PV327_005231 [Microctonus hyperodae]|uniref:Bardet-Biedl syndrome 2 protein homolog n=2 Tax=Microctonus hyperodae TaxID=165561 RepID=A0AA39G1D6_MICHY|nr:hypothetical protein PV327_005231 [Microctonus hyperodae]
MAVFNFNLQRKIEPSLVTCGKFDGSHPCLALATSAGSILIHSPHRQPPANVIDSSHENLERRLEWNGEIAELQIGRQIISLCTGRLHEDERDILIIGMHTHVLAYQVEENADLFYKQVADGAYSLAVGKLSWLPNPVTIIGGNCSVTILNNEGIEIFWTVMGDIVRSLAIFDFDGDGENELLAGTEDYELKVIKEDLILWETKETAAVTTLAAISGKQFAYVVGNGTVGIYEGGQRLWRIKSKHRVVAIKCYDVNGDGVMELVTGWNSGKIDARSCINGDTVFKLQINSAIAGIVEADYRRTGRPDLVIVSVTGEIRGYGPGSITDTPEPGVAIRQLIAKKQALLMELRQRSNDNSTSSYLSTKLAINAITTRTAARIVLASGPGLFIHCAIVFAEGVFEGETLVVHPKIPVGELEIELRPEKNTPVDIHVKVCLGSVNTDLFQVFEIVRQLPPFSMYELIPRPAELPNNFKNCGVFFQISERPQRVILWLNQSFLLSEEFIITDESSIDIWFRGMRDNKIHCLQISSTGNATIQTQDPNLAGDIIQSLAMYLGIQELGSEAKFPVEEQKLSSALERIKDLKEVDTRLQADAAGGSTLLKNLVIRLEDSRILNDLENMRKRLHQLKTINGDLIRAHEFRVNSRKELALTLKELNVGVRYAARLRVGHAATSTVTRCRAAIQEENTRALVTALQNG